MSMNSRQNWAVGAAVRVGFLSLTVRATLPPQDGLPGSYLLSNADGSRLYQFVPHNGLSSVTTAEAAELMARARVAVEAAANAEAAVARARSVAALINGALFNR